MDVFSLRDRVVDDYQRYVRGFVSVSEPNARRFVEGYFDAETLWPEPLVQLNPSFEPGRSLEELAAAGLVHRDCATFFRRREHEHDPGLSIRLHAHQDQAILAARTGASYVLSTGTGSGKSLAYFIPIVDHVLQRGPGQGVRAIVIYPMNALCNSQEEALKRFLDWGPSGTTRRVTYAKYTGQERDERRQEIWANPPDILLTNFAMLELILTRTDERHLVEACQGLEFLVLDELHTYRGRQGADVAMLVRRVRDRCGAPSLRCVGTSATLASQGTREQRQKDIAGVAQRLFGLAVPPSNVVLESVQRGAQGPLPTADQLKAALANEPSYPQSFTELAQHPLAIWAETAFGLEPDELGRLERRRPRTLTEVARELCGLTGVPEERGKEHLRSVLLAGCEAVDPASHFPLFAFRLHQFISRGSTVYATPEPPTPLRHFSAEGQRFVPGDRQRRLYPLAFCRVCGQDYLVVALRGEQLEPRYLDTAPATMRRPLRAGQLEPRDLDERAEQGSDEETGFVLVGEQFRIDDIATLPEEWLEERRDSTAIRSSASRAVPRAIRVTPDGRVLGPDEQGGAPAWFLPAPFRFCLGCQTTYASAREKDFSRLSQLSSEGRSTATTILSIAMVRALRGDESLPQCARKLLSFTDNRQDASLQAGHFNDFVQVTLLRAAIRAAVERAGPEGLSYEQVGQRVAEAMALAFPEYASNPEAEFAARRATDDAFRDVVGYRVYHDLRRGWRVNAPNLEQVGLLRIEYDELEQLCQHQETWDRTGHPDLVTAAPAQRVRVCRAVLNFMRRALAMKATYLDRSFQDQLRQRSFSLLRQPWAFDETEPLREASALLLPGATSQSRDDVTLSTRSLLGRYLRKGGTWPDTRLPGSRLKSEEFDTLVDGLLRVLGRGGYVEEISGARGAYRLNAATMRWTIGDGTVEPDPVRVGGASELEDRHVNAFFAELYRVAAANLAHLEAREHTAQVPAEEREKREGRFETADLPVLYCSPTMELGVDIRDLNAVNLRNVPPTPANYAQRSGRAGRSGQPALVLSYCTSTSSHDQYYFRRRPDIVAGAVAPPRLDLANEDLVRAHVHAVWLAETGQDLYDSVDQLLDLDPARPGLPLKDGVRAYVADARYQRAAEARCRRILGDMADELAPARAPWFTDEWLSNAVRNAPQAFDQAIDRWRHLYRSARELQKRQNQLLENPLTSAAERRAAERLRAEAEAQIKLLTVPERGRQRDVYSDFYSYRYFASQGFLPGYNFPRLPVTAFLPGRGAGRDGRPARDQEFLSRPRFVAISEFGPRTIVYHEGNRYRIHRVVLPRDETGGHTQSARFCTQCGYAHLGDRLQVDRCENCDTALDASTSRELTTLLRLESVSTYRVDRINCDEEERLRVGYEIITHFRFASRENGRPATRAVDYRSGNGELLATGKYAPATALWRVNLGWNRRKDRQVFGFMLDRERGLWQRSDQEPDAMDEDRGPLDPTKALERVVPYVEDRRNVLLLELARPLEARQLLSLMYALKRGIEASYQIEDSELGCEALPTDNPARRILFYEAAEGGAGVLVRLAEEADALARIARQALDVCHFDPGTLADRHRAAGGLEDCEAACYDCLLSYSNQRFHGQLDRKSIPEVLGEFADAVAAVGAGGLTRPEQRDTLLRACDSDLERAFVRWVDERGYRLPDRAQLRLGTTEGVYTQPDFYYEGTQACVYIDGHPHRYPERAARDAQVTGKLESLGYSVIRLGDQDTWSAGVAEWLWVFGTPTAETAGV